VLPELYKVLLQKERELKDRRSLPRTVVVSMLIFLGEEDTFQPLHLVCEFDEENDDRRAAVHGPHFAKNYLQTWTLTNIV